MVRDGHAATKFFDAADADPNAPCPALVLLDLNLPKKTGAEVLKHLRESRRCQAAQVLIVSSSDSVRDRASVQHLGAAGYFKKPTEYEAFMKLGPVVKALLEKPEHAATLRDAFEFLAAPGDANFAIEEDVHAAIRLLIFSKEDFVRLQNADARVRDEIGEVWHVGSWLAFRE